MPMEQGPRPTGFSLEQTPDGVQSLESAIQEVVDELVSLRKQLKDKKERLKNALDNSEEYRQACDDLKEVQKRRNSVKKELLKSNPELIEVAKSVKSLQHTVRGEQLSLSDYLLGFEKTTGLDHIQGKDGTLLHIKRSATIPLPF